MCKMTQEVGSRNAKDRIQTWGRLRLKIRCESNSRRTENEKGNSVTYCKGRFGNEKNFCKNGALNLDLWLEKPSATHFIWSFTQCRYVWKGHYWWWNVVFSIRPRNKMREHAEESIEFTSDEKSMHVSIAGQDNACVFLWSQGDNSLLIHCTRTSSKSTVLSGSSDKDTGIGLGEKTQNLAW
jgi:hypothetical protein